MIVGIGVDLTPVARMARAMANHPGRLEARLFTAEEQRYCRDRAQAAEHFAARFAAKEALLKAMRVPRGLDWHELEVVSTSTGAPEFALHGGAAQAAARLGVRRVHLSITHAGGHAVAMVVLEAGG